MVERYGSGIKRILSICRDYGCIRPIFEEIFDGFRVTLFKNSLNDTDRDTDHDTDHRLVMIIRFVQEIGNITTKELANKCAVSQITIKRDIEKLKSQNRLRRVGSAKGGYWEVTN
ncbi:ATP-dependent DNA helicase RecG [Williamwhitmania taraxaci]|uniref:ATP-dependent DNA helicase RecG n=2 Tax=Williamwhitmania taraxaci TaxID=1640674 RepID=A0A1G6GGQ1_9BACT|nr:ATP-dependent DNA helicase RecG [Williamwhitmania taraxaci]